MEWFTVQESIECKAGQEIVIHLPEEERGFRSALDFAMRGFHKPAYLTMRGIEGGESVQVRECLVARKGDVIHLYPPGTVPDDPSL